VMSAASDDPVLVRSMALPLTNPDHSLAMMI